MYPFDVDVEAFLSAAYGPDFARKCEWLECLLFTGFGGVLSKMRVLLVEPHDEDIARCRHVAKQMECKT